MKDYFFFSLGSLFESLSGWAYQKVSDAYYLFREEKLDREVEDRMLDLGMTKVTIFHVNEGPIHRDSIPDEEGVPEECQWLLEVKCRLNDDEGVVDIPLWFGEFNEAYAICNHFYNSVEPKVLYI